MHDTQKISCLSQKAITLKNINLLLTKRKGCTGEYWPKVTAVKTECSEVHKKTTKDQYPHVQLKQDRLVSSLTYMAQNKNYIIALWTLPWKWSVWWNLNYEGTLNQNTHTYLNTICTLPCNQFNTRVNYNLVVFSCHYYGARAINNGSQIKATN